MNKELNNWLGVKNSIAKLTSKGRKTIMPELIALAMEKHYMHDEPNGSQEKENELEGKSTNNQENNVGDNSGITGITGTGHTITINQCPKEIVEILSKLIEITKIKGL